MSIVCIQIGQCGNQLGQAFYSHLNQESMKSTPAHQAMVNETFFYINEKGKLTPKALLIDMEPKVVDMCLHKKYNQADTFQYDPELTYCKQEGSGNNWSYGYNIHGKKCEQDIIKKIDLILEKVDYFCQAIIIMQSLAGGTGSGLGSFVTKLIKKNHPEIPLLNICIMPHLTGEVILQSYNTVLTVSSLYNYSNGIILIENDQIEKVCKNLLKIKSPSLIEMNKVIANQLTSLFFPCLPNQKKTIFSVLQNEFQIIEDIIETLLLNPNYKLLKLFNVPQVPDASIAFNNELWLGLDNRITQMILSDSTEDQVNWSTKIASQNSQKCVGNLVIYRGNDFQKFNNSQSNFINPKLYNQQRIICKQIYDSHNFNKNDRSITCLTNNQSVVKNLELIAQRAHMMYQENAYLYQYEKYGTNKDDFLRSLATFENIIKKYQFQ